MRRVAASWSDKLSTDDRRGEIRGPVAPSDLSDRAEVPLLPVVPNGVGDGRRSCSRCGKPLVGSAIRLCFRCEYESAPTVGGYRPKRIVAPELDERATISASDRTG
jgi:hypothetical protein